MSKSADELLGGAIEVIERDGWHQRSLFKQPPTPALVATEGETEQWREAYQEAELHAPVCAMGALNRAATGSANLDAYDTEEYNEALDRLSAVVRSFDGYSGVIPSWNDAIGRSKEDVVLAFKKALHDS